MSLFVFFQRGNLYFKGKYFHLAVLSSIRMCMFFFILFRYLSLKVYTRERPGLKASGLWEAMSFGMPDFPVIGRECEYNARAWHRFCS